MNHETAYELTAGYALDALDEEDERALEAHLESCEECREQLDALRDAAAALAVVSAGPAPPEGLRTRLLEEARDERSNVIPLRPRRSRLVVASVATAAAAVLAAVGVGIYAASLSRSLDRERAAAEILEDPEARSIPVQGARGRLVVGADGRSALVLADLERAPAGRTYEVWIISGDQPRRAGEFEGDDVRDVVTVDGRVRRGQVVAVTVERDGGVDAPTTQPIFSAQA